MGDVLLGWLIILLAASIVLALIFVFIKAAVKSAIRDVMEEMALKKMEEEERKKW